MSTSDSTLESSLVLLEELALEDPELRLEFLGSRSSFPESQAGQADEARQRAAQRRHLEWFLLERPSEKLGGVPAQMLAEEWLERADSLERDGLEALSGSMAGVFEVTGVSLERGVWLRDLFGFGEYPLLEPEAATELSAGDLVVGRVFPVGDGLYRLSPAASCFRNRSLVEALHGDVERLRASRRGTLRIAQDELERLFFLPGALPATPSRSEVLRQTRSELTEVGLETHEVDALIDELVQAAASGDEGGGAVTEVLNLLAFETEVDLERARRALADLWAVLRAEEPASTPATASAEPLGTARAARNRRDMEDVRAALERFDEGRRSGRDLEALFSELEADLGLESSGGEDDDFAPDFPGVVGALVEEFIWDASRVDGPTAAEGLASLRSLSEYAAPIGVFEELGARELVDFCARWSLDQGRLRDARGARELLGALRAFCEWSEEQHAHALWKSFEGSWEALAEELPRHAELRRALGSSDEPAGELFELFALDGTRATLAPFDRSHRDEGEARLDLEAELAGRLRRGDLLRGARRGTRFACAAAYPAVLKGYLQPAG